MAIQPESRCERRRKTHTKSRKGCGNCKLRRVRCDEGKPCCEKCVAYGLVCKYGMRGSDMEPSMMGTSEFSVSAFPSEREIVLSHISRSSSPLEIKDLKALKHFQSRTVYTIGTTDSVELYKEQVMRLASAHPFLMHMLLTFAMMHEREMTGGQQTTDEMHHRYEGTAQFNRMLTRPIQHSERDAIWGTAAILGAIAYSAIDARTPEEAWPMKPPSVFDLDWLQISDGKKEMWRIADPYREDSVWHNMVKHHVGYSALELELKELPDGFAELFELDEPEGNPYYRLSAALSDVLFLECTYSNVLRFMSFIAHVDVRYKKLLGLKDARAMLLLACWHGKMAHYKNWWTQRRSVMEGRSIVTYLEKHYWDDRRVMEAVRIPKAMLR